MRVLSTLFVLLAVVGATACQQEKQPQRVDLSWMDDLELVGAASKPNVAATISPVELGLVAEEGPVRASPQPEAPPAPKKAAAAPQRRTTTARASSSRSGGASSPAPQREPRVVTVKNTKRDAAIGAGAGAVLGAAVAGKNNRVKGAVIGAAAGGVAGAVIGSTIDTKKRVEY